MNEGKISVPVKTTLYIISNPQEGDWIKLS